MNFLHLCEEKSLEEWENVSRNDDIREQNNNNHDNSKHTPEGDKMGY